MEGNRKKRLISSDGSGGGKGGRLRDIYAAMFRSHHILPDEAGRQNPVILFYMLDKLNDDGGEKESRYSGNDPYLKMFYGI